MKLEEIKQEYEKGEISKADFISKMYSFKHDVLFDYSEFIKKTDIQKIEILNDNIIMTSKELGIKVSCDRYDERIAPIEILNFNNYEKCDSDMIFNLVENEYTIFDIGANIGWYSIGLEKNKSDLSIYSFEPIPKTYKNLIKNIKLNKSKVNAFNLGLSDKKDELTFYFYKEGSGNASLQTMDNNRENIEVKCKVATLDNFINEHNIKALDFIKCDVEGAELLVFKGGAEAIRKFKPIIFTEILRKWSKKFNYDPNDIIEFFSNIGYECFFTEKSKLTRITRITNDTIQTNFFFLHLEKHRKEISQWVL